jgi:hypothetical protein
VKYFAIDFNTFYMHFLRMFFQWAGTAILLVSAFFVNAQQVIRVEASEISQHIQYLSSDAMKGRDTPSPGLDSAAFYIARHFKNMGLLPVGGSYFHDVGLVRIDLGAVQQFLLSAKGAPPLSFTLRDDFVPLETIGDTTVTAPVVFVGYGIHAPEMNYDDYQNLDVKDKIVVILTHYPREAENTPLSEYLKQKDWEGINSKLNMARKMGAAGAIILTDPLNHILLKPKSGTWSALSKAKRKPTPPLSFKPSGGQFPAVYGGEKVITALFGSVDALKAIQQDIDKNFKPQSRQLKDFTATLTTSVNLQKVAANNVMAMLPGNSPRLKNQYIVLGAHYDHVGIDKNAIEGADSIFNGADDNASGTATVLAIASTIVREKLSPERNLVFVLFAGEEAGLLGSRGMMKNPPFPPDSIAVMLNFDMVSRNGLDSLFIGGLDLCPELKTIANDEINGTGLKILSSSKGDGLGGSDHAPFLHAGIPALHFFTGLHRDYHQVSDEFSRTDPMKAARIAELGLRIALRVDSLPIRPVMYQKINKEP